MYSVVGWGVQLIYLLAITSSHESIYWLHFTSVMPRVGWQTFRRTEVFAKSVLG